MRAIAILLFACFVAAAPADDLAVQLKKLEELRGQAKGLTASSTREEVTAKLGTPIAMRPLGAWTFNEIWTYLYITNEDRHLSFMVDFTPEGECKVRAIDQTREEVQKLPLTVKKGVVKEVYAPYPEKDAEGFFCHVSFDDGLQITVGASDRKRIKGEVLEGSRIEVSFRGPPENFMFMGQNSLALEAMTFTKATATPAPEPGKP